jgi:hypothetical protein
MKNFLPVTGNKNFLLIAGNKDYQKATGDWIGFFSTHKEAQDQICPTINGGYFHVSTMKKFDWCEIVDISKWTPKP